MEQKKSKFYTCKISIYFMYNILYKPKFNPLDFLGGHFLFGDK